MNRRRWSRRAPLKRGTRFGVLVLCACALGCAGARSSERSASSSWLALRLSHPTQLRIDGPAPSSFGPVPAREGVEPVVYRSGGLALAAYLLRPAARAQRCPALVYLHGNFKLEVSSLDAVRPFVDAGHCVLLPTYRGEQGNPGRFELLFGEVDDAAAAVRWLAARPFVDPSRIDVIGHSVGGAIAALLSLWPELPLRSTASVGGLYVPETFVRWTRMPGNRRLIRFDVRDERERELRVLGPHLDQMLRPHVAYVGRDDSFFVDNARRLEAAARRTRAPLRVQFVPGDHMSSLAPGLTAYRALLAKRAPR